MVAVLLRTLLVLQLVAAQLAAPLVHAHVGGEAVAGKVHLPGLETLAAQPDQPSAQVDEVARELPGLVVGIATGLQSKPVYNLPIAQPVLTVPSAPLASVAQSRPPVLPRTSPSPAFAAPRLEQASPRAPPDNPRL